MSPVFRDDHLQHLTKRIFLPAGPRPLDRVRLHRAQILEEAPAQRPSSLIAGQDLPQPGPDQQAEQEGPGPGGGLLSTPDPGQALPVKRNGTAKAGSPCCDHCVPIAPEARGKMIEPLKCKCRCWDNLSHTHTHTHKSKHWYSTGKS